MSDSRDFVGLGVPYFALLLAFVISLVSRRWELDEIRAEIRSELSGELEALRSAMPSQGGLLVSAGVSAPAAVQAVGTKAVDGGALSGHAQRLAGPGGSRGKKRPGNAR